MKKKPINLHNMIMNIIIGLFAFPLLLIAFFYLSFLESINFSLQFMQGRKKAKSIYLFLKWNKQKNKI